MVEVLYSSFMVALFLGGYVDISLFFSVDVGSGVLGGVVEALPGV
jgi:hypothetical protein